MYLFIIILGIFLMFFVYLITKYSGLKSYTNFLIEEKRILEEKISFLENEKIEIIKKLQELQTRLDFEEKARNETMSSTKSVIFDLTHEITQKLIEIHKKETEESRNISEKNISKKTEEFNKELSKLQELFIKITKDIDESKNSVTDIKNALLSPISAGSLAELTLENILKNSGLRSELDFKMQYSFARANGDSNLRPDAVVFLPNNNLMVIDAKSSQFLMNQSDEKNLVKSMNNHIKNLSSKDYASEINNFLSKNNKDLGNIITLMFLPTEQSIEKLFNMDKNFLQKSWSLSIFPVGPVGLMNMLNMSKINISEELRIKNFEQITLEIGNLISSVSILSDHASKLGNSIVSLMNNYDKFAASFNRNFLSKTRNIQSYGINTNFKNTTNNMLERYQVVSTKNDLIEASETIVDVAKDE